MHFIAESTLNAVRRTEVTDLHNYAAALEYACESAPPPFGEAWYGQKFRRLATDAQWLAHMLVVNADVEGEGARKLWALAEHCPDASITPQIKRHAVDESRHAKLYASVLGLVFGQPKSEALRERLRNTSPNYASKDVLQQQCAVSDEQLLDDLIQMNLGEARTRIHQMLFQPVLVAYAKPEMRPRVTKVMDGLLGDETAHICYTAKLIEQACQQGYGDFVRETMKLRLEEFNDITLREVGGDQYCGE